MRKSDIQSLNTLSSSDFYQKIIRKYQIGKRKTLRLPMMILYEIKGHLLLTKISKSILLHFHMAIQNIIPCLTVKIIPDIKKVTSWLNPENTLQTIVSPVSQKNIQNVNIYEKNMSMESLKNSSVYELILEFFPSWHINTNMISIVSSLKSLFFKAGNIKTESDKILHIGLFNADILKSLKSSQISGFTSEFFPTGRIITKMTSTTSFLKSSFFKIRDTAIESNKTLKPLLLSVNSAFYPQLTHSSPSDNSIDNPQTLNYVSHMQIISPHLFRVRTDFEYVNSTVYPTIIEKENISMSQKGDLLKSQYLLEHRSPEILSHMNLLFNNMIFRKNKLSFERSNQAIVQKLLTKNYYDSFGEGKSFFFQRRDVYNSNCQDLHFHNQKNIEQEIENIKKVVNETKKWVLDKSKPSLGEADIKRYIDINRISSEVYQNIERTIRMERERRGI